MAQRQTNISNEEIKKVAYASSRIEGYPVKVSHAVKARISKLLNSTK